MWNLKNEKVGMTLLTDFYVYTMLVLSFTFAGEAGSYLQKTKKCNFYLGDWSYKDIERDPESGEEKNRKEHPV